MDSFKKTLKATAIGSLFLGTLVGLPVYQDFTHTSEMLPEVLEARICLQKNAAKYLPEGNSTFVDHYEEAFFALLNSKARNTQVYEPLAYAALSTYLDYNQSRMSYEAYLKLSNDLVHDESINDCAQELSTYMVHWSNLTNAMKKDKFDHKFRMSLYGPGYYQDWPAYIAN